MSDMSRDVNAGADVESDAVDSAKDVKQAPRRGHGPDELCRHCQALNITHRSFIVNQQDVGTGRRNTNALRTGMGDIDLQSYKDIRKSAETCRLCKLIDKAIKKCDPQLDTSQKIRCRIRWEVDGHRELDPDTFQNRTRRLRLTWQVKGSPISSEAFLIIVAQSNAELPNSDVGPYRIKSQTFRAREVRKGQGKQALIKSWLDICCKEHKNACGIATQRCEFNRLIDETYFGVIDVTDLQLKPLPRDQRGRPSKFVALSYVWGDGDQSHITTRLNVPIRRQHGGLERDLNAFPTVIKDAIKLVQRLNMRYLWIDALCIVQGDNSVSWRLNAAEMHVIYGNAHFTICAADGSGAETGLVAMETDVDQSSVPRDSEEILPGLRLQIARPPEMVIKNSKWNSRGWTYQERILSRRCVVFAEGRVYYQCRKTAFSEDVHNDAKGSGWSLQAMGAPLRYFVEIELRCFAFYMKSVSMFYKRDLSHPEDILAAYKGIQAVMELVMYAPFCFGLPTSHFDLALLWEPRKPIKRRNVKALELPSWSWCGWEGGDIDHVAETLDGALVSTQEWLSNHTWIRYHILDGRGQLRPLWDRHKILQDSSREQRWRGYPGLPACASQDLPPDDVSSTEDSGDEIYAQVGVRPKLIIDHDRGKEYVLYRSPHRERGRYAKAESGYGFLQRDSNARVLDNEGLPQEETAEAILRTVRRSQERGGRRRRNRSRSRSRSRRRYESEGSRASSTSSAQLAEINVHLSRLLEESRGARPFAQQRARGHFPRKERVQISTRRPDVYTETRLPASDEELDTDSWGREYGAFSKDDRYINDRFSLTHPESPYQVKKAKWTKPDSTTAVQDLPVLQFWTMLKRLRVLFHAEIAGTADGEQSLVRCHIGDAADDWCGSVIVDSEWSRANNGKLCTFIALSEAKSFSVEEGLNWNYYTPRERTESEWEVVYALLIELNEEKHVWERLGLAKIFRGAFSGDCWQEIMLG